MADEIKLDQLLTAVNGDLSKIANKKELTDFIKNSFLVSVMADEHDTTKEMILRKIKELIAIM
jgi:hypothetical protein